MAKFRSHLRMLGCKSCSWKDSTDISEMKTWPFSGGKIAMGKRLQFWLFVSPPQKGSSFGCLFPPLHLTSCRGVAIAENGIKAGFI